jgi:hypothetical protein
MGTMIHTVLITAPFTSNQIKREEAEATPVLADGLADVPADARVRSACRSRPSPSAMGVAFANARARSNDAAKGVLTRLGGAADAAWSTRFGYCRKGTRCFLWWADTGFSRVGRVLSLCA